MARILDTSYITTTVGMPLKKGTLDHFENKINENTFDALRAIIGPTFGGSPYILYGCVNSGSGLVYDISAGAIFYGGELFRFDGASFTAVGAQVAVMTLATTYTTSAAADPVEFTDGSSHNVHSIRKFTCSAGLTGTGEFDFSDLIKISPFAEVTISPNAHYTVTQTVKCRKNRDGLVTTKGILTCLVTAVAGDIIYTYPSGYRPPTIIYVQINVYSAAWYNMFLTIGTNGDVTLVSTSIPGALTGYVISLTDIPPFYNS